ncbi:MAG: DUF4349 domain-containing protein [Actinomycetota bacterium]
MRPKLSRRTRYGALILIVVLGSAYAAGSLAQRDSAVPSSARLKFVSGGGGSGDTGVLAPQLAPAAPGFSLEGAPVSDQKNAVTAVSGGAIAGFDERVMRTADMWVEVPKKSFSRTWDAVYAIAKDVGGQVLSANRGDVGGPVPLQEESDQVARGDITMRVPAERLETALRRLREVGLVRSESTSSEDVTQQYVDLQSQQRHLRAEEVVLLRLFSKAKSIGDTLAVQTRLSEVQGQIEQITGQIKYIDARTDYSMVSVHLGEPGAIPRDETGPSFAKAWETALDGLVRMGTGALILGVWLGPFAALVIVIWGARRMRKPTASRDA